MTTGLALTAANIMESAIQFATVVPDPISLTAGTVLKTPFVTVTRPILMDLRPLMEFAYVKLITTLNRTVARTLEIATATA